MPAVGCTAALAAFLLPLAERSADGTTTIRSGLSMAIGGEPESLVAALLTCVVFGLAVTAPPLVTLRRACFALIAVALTLAASHGGHLLIGGWIAVGGLVVGGMPWEWLWEPMQPPPGRREMHLASDAVRRAS